MKRLLSVARMVLVSLVGRVGLSHGRNEVTVLHSKTLRTVVMATIFVASFLLSSVAFTQPIYPIVCRGGGDLLFNYMPSSNFSPNPHIRITFQRGAQKVGSNWENIGALMPGQCSWIDRPIAENEPNMIIVKDMGNFSISWNQGRVIGVSSESSYMIWLQDANRYQSFDVSKDGQGIYLIMTGIGQAR